MPDEDDAAARRMVEINVRRRQTILRDQARPGADGPARDGGHIVNIASQAGKTYGLPGGATYSATKHAVVGFTEAVRGEMRLKWASDYT